jgi:ankyrin repeat protein
VASVFLDPDDYFVNDILISGGGSVPLRQTFLRTIVQQVSKGHPKTHSHTDTIDDLRSRIKLGCTPSRKTYIIVDGLDRCPAGSRHELEDEITSLVEYGCCVMITNYLGLPMDDITEYTCEKCNWDHLSHYWNCRTCGLQICDSCTDERNCVQLRHDTRRLEETAIELAPSDEEMCMFIGHELRLRLEQGDFDADLHEHLEPQLERVERSICDSSRGALVICKSLLSYLRDFQWAGYEEIMQVQTRVLRPEEETFNVLLSKVKSQDPVSVTTALTSFSLVSQILPGSAMVFKELADALRHLKIERAINKQDLYALCQGMIVIDSDGTVRPFHDDFSIHLQENCVEDFRCLRIDLADIAIEMLQSLPCHGFFTADTDRALRDELSKRPFLGYAAPNWGRHLRQSAAYRKLKDGPRPPAGSLTEQAVNLMQNPSKLAACLYLANIDDQWFDLWPGCHPLHVCAWFGLTKFINYFTSDVPFLIDAADPVYGRTPLMIAASRGHTEFAQRMIQLGADVTFTCEEGRLALLEAVEHDSEQQGYYDTTEAILEHMPNFKMKGHARATTPLIACIGKRGGEYLSSQLLSLLLKHPSTDVNETTLEGHTALMEAVAVGASDPETICLLLKHEDLKLDVQDRAGRTALHLAVQSPQTCNTAIMNLLHSSHCTPAVLNVSDFTGMTAAMLLLRNEEMRREDVILVLRSMSERGADLLCTDNNGRGLLHAAAAGEHALAVDFLHYEKKLPLDAADSFGWSALHYASRTRAPDTIRRLLELGASSMLCDARGWSPFDIISCDDPENEHVQKICGLLNSSDLQHSPAVETFTPLRPAWTFATCDLDEFHERSVSATDDFWLPDPKCGNLVRTVDSCPIRAVADLDRLSTVLSKRTIYLSANGY